MSAAIERPTRRGQRVLIVGCGYLGTRVARRLIDRGYDVWGTTRSSQRADDLVAAGIRPVRFDLASAGRAAGLREEDWDLVLYSIPSGRDHGAVATLGALDALDGARLRAFVFVSSTGVYAQSDGSAVDEETVLERSNERAARLIEVERAVLARAPSAPVIALRLGGLYGPERSPIAWMRDPEFRARLRGGSRALMNWIHIDDAAAVAVGALERGVAGRVYLGVDGHAVARGEFWAYAARLAGVGAPEFPDDSDDLGKRISNRRAVEELGVTLRYPDYRRGLEAIAGRD